VEESTPRKKAKIDLDILTQKQREGMTRKEIAKYYGVSTHAMGKALRRNQKAVTLAIVFEKPTPASSVPMGIRSHLVSLQMLDEEARAMMELNRDAWRCIVGGVKEDLKRFPNDGESDSEELMPFTVSKISKTTPFANSPLSGLSYGTLMPSPTILNANP
jgi:hypothetical protein